MNGNIGTSSLPKTSKGWANSFRALVNTSYNKKTDYRNGLVAVMDTDLEDDRLVQFGGFNQAPTRRNAGETAVQAKLREGYANYIHQIEFDLENPIDYQQKKFQGQGVNLMTRSAKEMASKFYVLEQKAPLSAYNYGFVTTGNTYLASINGTAVPSTLPDGKALFSVLHPTFPDNSATWSNALSAGNVVSEAACDLMLQNLYAQPDDAGEPKNYGEDGVYWVVPRAYYKTACEIVGSANRSGTADNDMNVFKDGKYNGFNVEVITVPFLSNWSSTAHYMIDKNVMEKEMPIQQLYSERFSTKQYSSIDGDTEFVKGRVYFGVGIIDGRGLCGSKGDGAAYSA